MECTGSKGGGLYCAACAAKHSFIGANAWQHTCWSPTDVTSEALQRAYAGRFSETPEVCSLWTYAAATSKKPRDRFFALLGSERKLQRSVEAYRDEQGKLLNSAQKQAILEKLLQAREFIRNVLDAAGCELVDDDLSRGRSPRIKWKWGDQNLKRMEYDRLLAVEHAEPQSKNRSRATDPTNLRWMLHGDNLFRGDRWNEKDKMYDSARYEAWLRNELALSPKTKEAREFRAKVLKALVARQNAGDGRVCVACGSDVVMGLYCSACRQTVMIKHAAE
jgi:hypothetical protein